MGWNSGLFRTARKPKFPGLFSDSPELNYETGFVSDCLCVQFSVLL